LGWCIKGFGGAFYKDWDGVLEGLEEPITVIGMAYSRDCNGLLHGLGWCIRGIGGAYYRDWDGVLEGLGRPITGIGMLY
jgi:hypothetical protein